MEIRLRPETESRIHDLAAKTGRAADDLVEDAMAGYLQEIGQTREMLDRRYDALKNGTVKAVDGGRAFASLRRKSQERRSSANFSSTRRHTQISPKSGNTLQPTTSTLLTAFSTTFMKP